MRNFFYKLGLVPLVFSMALALLILDIGGRVQDYLQRKLQKENSNE